MRNIFVIVMLSLTFHTYAIDHVLIEKALKGDNDAKYQIAVQLVEPNSEYYSPDKAQEMLLSLAQLGDTRAFSPLARIFADPTIENYTPRRSLFYLTKVSGDNSTRKALYEVLAGSRSPESLDSVPMRQSDPLMGIISSMAMYPFDNMNKAQQEELKKHFTHPSVAPFEPYIYPAIITPFIGNTHLYNLDSLALNENWTLDSSNGRYIPLRDNKGVKSIDISGLSNNTFTLFYNVANYEAIRLYYESFLPSTKVRNGFNFNAPGVDVHVSRNFDHARVIFRYKTLRPLIQSRKEITKRLSK